MARSIGLREVEHFLRRELKRSLADDIVNTKMLREADLQSCSYAHIRRFIEGDDKWRVFNARYVPKMRTFPDIVIVHRRVPQIAMELKWKRRRISRNDRKKLIRALKELRLKKVYFLTTAEKKSSYTKLGSQKLAVEKHRLHEIVVTPSCSAPQLRLLKAERRGYRAFAA